MITLCGFANMASGQDTGTARHQDMSPASNKGLGRRIKVSVVSLAVFAVLLVLQQSLLSVQISDLVPQQWQSKNTTALSGLTSSEAKEQMRIATARLHPTKLFKIRFKWGNSTPASNSSECQKEKKKKKKKKCKKRLKRQSKSAPNLGPYRTCAVVGNGGILLDSHCGDDIDAKDYVIRANLPALDGFETDVGRRTNMTFVNTNVVKRLNIASKLEDRTRDPYPTRLRHFNNTVIVGNRVSKLVLQTAARTNGLTLDFWTCKHDLRKNKIINPIASRVAGWRFNSRPSSGLTTVLITSTFCQHLSLYGFYPYSRDTDNKPIPYHYFPDDGVDEAIVNRNKHHLPVEFRLYRELHRRGVLTLQEGRCERQENRNTSSSM
ncbi:CMP-N-acetylneuraminate-poly-alpha-2,8-sialyltransferase-like [Branchiostoma floridae x Branchiostoma belcheri]